MWRVSLIDALVILANPSGLSKSPDFLRARPTLGHTLFCQDTHEWGGWVAQHHTGADAVARQSGRTLFYIGRPSIRRSKVDTALSVVDWIVEHTPNGLAAGAEKISESLSGMYAVFEITDQGITVLTDRMGFRPVYLATDSAGRLVGVGTHLESLAHATDQSTDFDRVSLAELLVHNFVTFPFTTRTRIRECDPCSVTTIDACSGEVSTRVLWEPTEPRSFGSVAELAGRLGVAITQAADDITHGCTNAAVLLSGGFDSRLVLAAMPKDRLGAALTYITNPNRETEVARMVADAGGVEHVLVQRAEDYFPNLVERGMGLLGMELRGNTHGLCLADNDLAHRFDVIIGGQLSDTLLKDHFMPFAQRDALRTKGWKSILREMVKGPVPARVVSPEHTTGRGQLECHLCPEIRGQVRARKEARMEAVRRVRPTSGDEWHRFWPCSRQDDSSHTLGNARLTISDTLFAHTDLVEVARDLSPAMRVGGALADAVFMDICGPLAEITNANTGLPANTSVRALRKRRRQERLKRQRSKADGRQAERTDWNAVENSWADPVAMQKHAPFWIENRARLTKSPAVNLLDGILERGGAGMIGSYQDDLPSTTNHIAMQMMLWADGLLNSTSILDAEVRS